MVGQKERFLTNGQFLAAKEGGKCHSPFCKSGCGDSSTRVGAIDPVTLWREVFEQYEQLEGFDSSKDRFKAAGAAALSRFNAEKEAKA